MENMFIHELQIFMVEFPSAILQIAIIMWLLLFLNCKAEKIKQFRGSKNMKCV